MFDGFDGENVEPFVLNMELARQEFADAIAAAQQAEAEAERRRQAEIDRNLVPVQIRPKRRKATKNLFENNRLLPAPRL